MDTNNGTHTSSNPKGSESLNSNDSSLVRVRCFRRSDLTAVRKICWECMVACEGSPARVYLSKIMQKPSCRLAIALFVLSIAVEIATLFFFDSWRMNTSSAMNSFLGPSLSKIQVAIAATVTALFSFLYLCCAAYTTVGFYYEFYANSLRTDYNDPENYYELRPASDGDVGKDPELEPIGKKGLWVAEIVSPKTGKPEVVGTITLDNAPSDFTKEPNVFELRRMFVSHHHRNRGIAAALIRVCEAHARATKVSAILLRTTIYQAPARKLYEKYGYKKGSRAKGATVGMSKVR
ncbi:hypothetical protein D9757_005942 [Collybiopsis confluens]|uniref:N-acetyltransferase domain-containing protein n=1 Tax=Collybiopsis confluens TaxID=2823264 RepID=A0A8H5HNG4_9AGAR|nr:hypothetical protein D9757_005942 [Collybiopsis confluens]